MVTKNCIIFMGSRFYVFWVHKYTQACTRYQHSARYFRSTSHVCLVTLDVLPRGRTYLTGITVYFNHSQIVEMSLYGGMAMLLPLYTKILVNHPDASQDMVNLDA